ncbi:unnamed protein product [Meloidogyne enterolobii]|uniref:Uncharacterized protein n=1 Tax=Meloidogyne enterolobii TaxID=390850 RepID=A0ACB0YM37_MELEN
MDNRSSVTASGEDNPDRAEDNSRTTGQASGQNLNNEQRQQRTITDVLQHGRQGGCGRPIRGARYYRSREDNNGEQQLQAWAQETSRRQLTDLEEEFGRLQGQPRPEPSEEFARNPTLNRRQDVICVENNRIILSSGRYIHANWINSQGNHRYICTQGPLPQTVDDFWEMVLQEKVEAVLMLCDTIELDRPICHQYWPTDNSPESAITSRDGNIRVRFVDTEALDDNNLIRTRLQVTSDNPKRQMCVRHFQWRRWTEQEVPMNLNSAIRLYSYIRGYKPIVIHCSEGIGRTGVIVAICMALNTPYAGQRLNLYELVTELRRHRAGSVQTLEQYLYIYAVILRCAWPKARRNNGDVEAIDSLVQAISRRIYRGI